MKFSIEINRFNLLFQLALAISTAHICKAQDETKNKIELDELPERFTNAKLLYDPEQTNQCFDHLGCFERIPSAGGIQDALTLRTKFKFETRRHEILVLYEPTEVCLASLPGECAVYPYDLRKLFNSPSYDPNLRTIILTPGYRTGDIDRWQILAAQKWLRLEDVNVISVSWAGGNMGLYPTAVANTRTVARQITVLLYYLAQLNNLNLADESFLERIYLIGHSLGAHISGFVGQDLAGRVGRITGLDPAGPRFTPSPVQFKLDRTDAMLVDAIHTNGGNLTYSDPSFGTFEPVGHVDYFANDGKRQPSCHLYDLIACSHKIAVEYYHNFLNHEFYLRQHLDDKYHHNQRLFAFASESFESFQNGSSLSKLCPKTTLDDLDVHYKDIAACAIPIDFVTWPNLFRQELAEKYNISFDLSAPVEFQRRYFFYTSPAQPYLNNHNLLEMRVNKKPQEQTDSQLTDAQRCDFSIDFKMGDDMTDKHSIKAYQLLDAVDHYQVIVPYLSPNTISKYELAKLDAFDFFLNETDLFRLRAAVGLIFPTSIKITGLEMSSKKRSLKNKIWSAIGNFFSSASSSSAKKSEGDMSRRHECESTIERVAIQPLKKLRRHLVATYSLDSQGKDRPDVVVLVEGDQSPKIDLLRYGLDSNISRSESEIFIDTIIIGPLDTSEDQRIGDALDEPNGDPEQNTTPVDSSSISANTWLLLTIIASSMLMIFIALFIFNIITYKNSHLEEDNTIIIDNLFDEV